MRALDGEICFDEKGELPHRGAWLCAKRVCMIKAFSKKLLFRGEKTLPVQPDAMADAVYERIKKSSLSRLGFLRKLGQIEAGRDAVMTAMRAGKIHAVVVAHDFSKRSEEEVIKKGSVIDHEIMKKSPFLMDEIGQSLGRKKTGVVGLSKSRITEEVLLQLKKLSNLAR